MWARQQATAVLSLERIKLDFNVEEESLVALQSSVSSCWVFFFLSQATGFRGTRHFPQGTAGGAVCRERSAERAEFADARKPDHLDSHAANSEGELEHKRGENSWPALHPSARLHVEYRLRALPMATLEKWFPA